MRDFNYKNDTKIIFGANAIYNLEAELKTYNVKKMLVLSSGDFIKDLGIYQKVENTCKKLNIEMNYNNQVVSNPQIKLVRELIELVKKEDIDFVLAIGGGSVMDSAKAIAVGAKSEIDVWDFYLYTAEPKEALPIGVISTIPASGSESSNCSIMSNEDAKLGIEYDFIIPKFAIINPEYTKTLPAFQLGAGISDMSTHLIERYYTNVKRVDTTDYMIEGLLKGLILNASRLMENMDDMDARSDIFLTSIIAHNNILDSGREADWASHRIEHELSAEYGLTHGEGMALVIVAYTRYMAKHNPEKIAQLANRLFDIDYHNHSLEKMCLLLADNLEAFYRKIGMRTRLPEHNIDDKNFEKMALKATKNDTQTIGHYLPMKSKEMIEVLKLAL